MRRDEAIRRLKNAEPELRARGVTSLALFGSTARDEAGPNSDVDVLVELDLSQHPTLIDLSRAQRLIQDQMGCPSDLVMRDSLRPAYRANAEADAILVF